MLLLVDQYSGWVEASPAKKEDASSVVKMVMKDWIPRRGFPKQIRSDNGSHFSNFSDLQKVEKAYGITH